MIGRQLAIREAAANGHVATVTQLLADPRVDIAAYNDLPLRAAAAGGHTATVELLLADPRVQPSARQNQALRLAASYGYLAIVKLLLADPRRLDPFGAGQALRAACAGGHIAVVECLLADPRVQLNDAIQGASDVLRAGLGSGSTAILDLLLADARIRPCNYLVDGVMGDAVRSRNIEMVSRLLRRATLDGAGRLMCTREALATAADIGDIDLYAAVESCVAVHGVTVTVGVQHGSNVILHRAISGGSAAIFERAFALGTVDFRPGNRELAVIIALFIIAATCLCLARVTAATNILQQALAEACFLGHADVAARLLTDPRLSLSGTAVNGAWVLSIAASRRHPKVVSTLLAHPRVAGGISGEQAAAFAHQAAQPRPPGLLREYQRHAAAAMPPPNGGQISATLAQWAAAITGGRGVSLQQLHHAFHTAAARGDSASLHRLLADPMLDPQALGSTVCPRQHFAPHV